MELVVHQEIYYSNRGAVPVREIAESLLALEGILQQSPPVLEKLFPGCSIQRVEVFLDELRSDSLWEQVVIKFLFGEQKKFDEFIESMRDKLGMEKISANHKLLSVLLICLILAGGSYLLSKDKAADPNRRMTIEGNNNLIINIGAEVLEMNGEQLRAIIDTAIKDKERLGRDAAKFVKPAKRDPEATITFNNQEELRISADAVRAMPEQVADPDPEQRIDDYENVELSIRATDLDSFKKGWAGVIPSLGERRVKFQLDPGIDPAHLLLHPQLRADVTVVSEITPSGDKRPKLILIRKVVSPKPDKEEP